MTRNISDRKMASYWAKRLAELEAARPITAQEATAEAERLEESAAARRRAEYYAGLAASGAGLAAD